MLERSVEVDRAPKDLDVVGHVARLLLFPGERRPLSSTTSMAGATYCPQHRILR